LLEVLHPEYYRILIPVLTSIYESVLFSQPTHSLKTEVVFSSEILVQIYKTAFVSGIEGLPKCWKSSTIPQDVTPHRTVILNMPIYRSENPKSNRFIRLFLIRKPEQDEAIQRNYFQTHFSLNTPDFGWI
jgi:hypothetical protein